MPSKMVRYVNNFKHLYAQEFRSISEEYKIAQLEIDIVIFLFRNPEYNTARDITELRGFSKSNVSASVDDLRSRGYIISKTDEHSRRIQRLFLTDTGAEAARRFAKCQDHCFEIIFSGFTEDDKNLLTTLLDRMDENIIRALKPDAPTRGSGL